MINWEIVYEPTRKLIEDSIVLDKIVFNDECDICDIATCMEWTNKNNKLYTFLLKDNKLIGYINLMPVTDEFYNRFKDGKTKDFEITASDIVGYEVGKPVKCIFVSIVLHPDYQKTMAVKYLLDGFIQKIKNFQNKGYIISDIAMDCVSEMGERCARNWLKASQVAYSRNGKIYEGNFDFLNNK